MKATAPQFFSHSPRSPASRGLHGAIGAAAAQLALVGLRESGPSGTAGDVPGGVLGVQGTARRGGGRLGDGPWLVKMAIEIVDFPMNNGDFP